MRYSEEQIRRITEALDSGSSPRDLPLVKPPAGMPAMVSQAAIATEFGLGGAFIYQASRPAPAYVTPGTNPAENFDSSGIILDAIGGVPFTETIIAKNAGGVPSNHTAKVYTGGLLRNDMTTETTVSSSGGIATGLPCDYVVMTGTPSAAVHIHLAAIGTNNGYSFTFFDHLGNVQGNGSDAGPVSNITIFSFDSTGYLAVQITGDVAHTVTTYNFSVTTAIAPFTFTGIDLEGGWLYEVRCELTLSFDGSSAQSSGTCRIHIPLFISPPASDPMDMDSVESWSLTDIPTGGGGGSDTEVGGNVSVWIPAIQTARLTVVIEASGPDPGATYGWTEASFSIQQLGNLQ